MVGYRWGHVDKSTREQSIPTPNAGSPPFWHVLFEAQARRQPDAIALIRDESSVSYRVLDETANRLARALIARGVGPGTVVALVLPRSVRLVVALLAVAKTGAAYLPIAIRTPQERARFMLANAGVALVLTADDAGEALGLAAGVSVMRLDAAEVRREVDSQPSSATTAGARITELQPAHPAYVLYTSGSTGEPKGVMVSHAALGTYLTWACDYYEAHLGDGAPLITPLSFDASIASLHAPLLSGRPVFLLPETGSLEALAELMLSGLDLTLVKLTPSHLEGLRMILADSADRVRARSFVIGGEPLSRQMATFWQRHCPNVRLINQYGPTEATVACCAHTISADEDTDTSVPIGRPMPGNDVYILDPDQVPVRPGEVGELYIAGGQLADGYVSRPDLTRERFLACPLGSPGRRMYRTGDLATERPDGSLDFLGRVDRQVKIRGYRIELTEIESILATAPGVGQVAVESRAVGGQPRLVAYVVRLAGSAPLDRRALTRRMALMLPDYMIPSIIVELDALPLTVNGKLDRAALPEPEIDNRPISTPPSTPTQARLSELFERLTNAAAVGMDDDFFDLGGDSLRGLELILEIERSFNLKLPFSALYMAPTIRELGAIIDEGGIAFRSMSVVPLRERGGGTPIFMIHWIERDLARWLCTDRPFYGLAYGIASTRPEELIMPTRIEDIARHYIRQMKAVQSEGPYSLVGHSLGGLIAYEMAVQLTEDGDTVDFLGLLDTNVPALDGPPEHLSPWDVARNILRTPPSVLFNYMMGKLSHRLPAVSALAMLSSAVDPPLIAKLRGVRYSALHYNPRPYLGRVDLFKPTTGEFFLRSKPRPPETAWSKLATGGLEIHEVHGTHLGIVKEPAAMLTAKAIERAMQSSYRLLDR